MNYRTIILVTAISAGFGIEAQAQDRWAGFYGGISMDSSQTKAKVGSNATHSFKTPKDIIISGIYAGYNFTGNGGFVWGPEVGLIGLANKGTKTDAVLGTSQFEGSYLLSSRLRVGWGTDKYFFYGAAGLAMSDAGVKPSGISGKTKHTGFSYGLGVEMAFSDNWSGRFEVKNYDFGKAKAQSFNGSSQKVNTDIRVISIGISRKF